MRPLPHATHTRLGRSGPAHHHPCLSDRAATAPRRTALGDDLTSFCRLLRTGVDPAYVIIDRVMPTYDVSDAACASLWQYLTQ